MNGGLDPEPMSELETIQNDLSYLYCKIEDGSYSVEYKCRLILEAQLKVLEIIRINGKISEEEIVTIERVLGFLPKNDKKWWQFWKT